METPVRIGILGAARIAPYALIAPARLVPEVSVTAIAAREQARAEAFARKHGLPRAHGSYEALLADPEITAVYIPLPNALHAEWTLKALAAGKHVLCEKPFTSNAAEAEKVAQAARAAGRIAMEAFHYRYHPLSLRIVELMRNKELGAVKRVTTHMCIPLPVPGDIRYKLELGGGANMDTGSYALSMARHYSGEEPEVTAARAKLASPGVDRCMEAELRFPSGATGKAICSMWSWKLLRIDAQIECEGGTISAFNPVAPHIVYHHLKITTPSETRREQFPKVASYTCQLRAFAAAIQQGAPLPTDADDAVKNMRLIDAVYRAAGLAPRPSRLPA